MVNLSHIQRNGGHTLSELSKNQCANAEVYMPWSDLGIRTAQPGVLVNTATSINNVQFAAVILVGEPAYDVLNYGYLTLWSTSAFPGGSIECVNLEESVWHPRVVFRCPAALNVSRIGYYLPEKFGRNVSWRQLLFTP